MSNPIPKITSISPVEVLVGTPFTLAITGSNFISSSEIHFGTDKLATTFVDSKHLTAVITATDLEQRLGAKRVYVHNPTPGGGNSNVIDVVLYANLIKVVNSLLDHDFLLSIDDDNSGDVCVIPANAVNFDLGAILSGDDLDNIQDELKRLVNNGDISVVSSAPEITYNMEAAAAGPSGPTVPSVVASVSLMGIAADIPLTTLFTPTVTGLYRVTMYAPSTAGNGSDSTPSVVLFYTDDSGNVQTAPLNPSSMGGTGYYVTFVSSFEAVAGQPVTYSALGGAYTTLVYSLYMVVEQL